jgi:exosortase/archaeosortase family protein
VVGIWIHVLSAVVAVFGLFFLLVQRMQDFEAWLVGATLRSLGFGIPGLPMSEQNYVLAIPHEQYAQRFLCDVTPSCSSLASVLALLALGTFLPPSNPALAPPPAPGHKTRAWLGRHRRIVAIVAAVAVVFIGNQIRLDSSVAAGYFYGRTVLVLFHDWAGSVFGFAYIFGGYILMIWIYLPDRGGKRPVSGHGGDEAIVLPLARAARDVIP